MFNKDFYKFQPTVTLTVLSMSNVSCVETVNFNITIAVWLEFKHF